MAAAVALIDHGLGRLIGSTGAHNPIRESAPSADPYAPADSVAVAPYDTPLRMLLRAGPKPSEVIVEELNRHPYSLVILGVTRRPGTLLSLGSAARETASTNLTRLAAVSATHRNSCAETHRRIRVKAVTMLATGRRDNFVARQSVKEYRRARNHFANRCRTDAARSDPSLAAQSQLGLRPEWWPGTGAHYRRRSAFDGTALMFSGVLRQRNRML
jgi:hypothetical protein